MAIQAGIIGTGFGAQVHAPILQQHPAYNVTAISAIRPGRAANEAANHGIPNAFNDWRRMISDLPLDLIVVASSPDFHMEMTIFALEAGCHVVCEKPPALNAAEVRAMKEIAKRHNRKVFMNFEWRYLPQRQAIKRILEHNELGDIFHVNWSEAWPLWPKIKEDDNGWQWRAENGGGMLGAVGSHMIDALQFWFGPFLTVQGFTSRHVHERRGRNGMEPSTADDSFFVHGAFERGGTYALQFIMASAGRAPRIEIFGTKGSLILEGEKLTMAGAASDQYIPVHVDQPMDASSFPAAIKGYVHAQWMFYHDLAEVVAGGFKPALATLSDAEKVQTAIDKINNDQ
ncbi:Gfo/Idh/MocA family protein [Paenibacillus beijingensis]|uniref:Gfo/Idh/MocA family protein n=1 Tax=Paenibacillus beijingensis TaxID=1126833 RepID=UPI000698B2FB|nr:Gfo/Idh/MocA family oxidoreductase [Paenibacillus beijingensis]